jgi:hypothetical protein
MNKQVITLQGKAYDAVTGAVIHDVVRPKPVHKKTTETVAKPPHTRSGTNHLHAHAVQPSRILMRRAVKKPGKSTKRQLHVQTALSHSSTTIIAPKHSVAYLDIDRLSKAQQVDKHHNVSHFDTAMDMPVTFAAIPVRQAPQDIPAGIPPTAPPPTQTNRPVDIFEHAIENATHFVDIASQKSHFKKKARRHALSMAAGTLAFLLIAGFAAYQNTPGIQLKLAGIRAGVATAKPNFEASSFAYNGATAEQSRLVIGLKDSHGQYQLSEQKTNWSGSEMIEQVSAIDASGQTNYSMLQAGFSTVYRFGSTQATWVKNGIWYQVNGDNGLTEAQLKDLVQNT